MFKNLQAEMERQGITAEQAAAEISITARTFERRMTGKTKRGFTLLDFVKIQRAFFKDLTIDYLSR